MAETEGEGAQEGPYYHKERIKYSPDEEARLERQHFWRIIDAFRFYRYNINARNKARARQRQFVTMLAKQNKTKDRLLGLGGKLLTETVHFY